jgi:hypothetical protein
MQRTFGPVRSIAVTGSSRRRLIARTMVLGMLSVVLPAATGCGAPDAASTPEQIPGRLRIGLGAELEGTQYWLEATFYVAAGSQSTTLGSTPGETSLSYELTPGSYAVEIGTDFRVLRESGGALEQVEAELLSDIAQPFQIDPESTTRVIYRFAVGSKPIEFGPGELAIDFEVEARAESEASLRFVSPYIAVSGRPGTFVARGSGLGAPTSELTVLIGDLEVGPLQPDDETQVKVEYPGLPAGRYPVSVQSSTASVEAELVVVDPPVAQASVTFAQGPRSRLVYDAERQRLYAVNRDSHQIERYQSDGGGWTALPARTVPQLTDIALMPDGRSLIVLSRGAISQIHLEDESWTLFTQQPNPDPFCGSYFDEIAMGNDGKAMVIFNYAECSGFSTPFLYDGVTASFVSAPLGIFYDGNVAASADGTRVYAGSNGVSPAQSVASFDTRSWVGAASNPVAYNLYAVTVSGDASRVILQNTAVYDRALALLGFIPGGGVALASRDSTRAFVYREDGQPRVDVYDLNAEPGPGAFFPAVASIELSDEPNTSGGAYTVSMTTSPDDSLLVVSGSDAIVAIPVP